MRPSGSVSSLTFGTAGNTSHSLCAMPSTALKNPSGRLTADAVRGSPVPGCFEARRTALHALILDAVISESGTSPKASSSRFAIRRSSAIVFSRERTAQKRSNAC
jgi:hypothetical protein